MNNLDRENSQERNKIKRYRRILSKIQWGDNLIDKNENKSDFP